MKNTHVVITATLMRILLGWYMFVDGYQILTTPHWSSHDFLVNAKMFPAFYAWFAQPTQLWWVDLLNPWGVTLIGAALILGLFVRPAAWAGVVLMLLYYFPQYNLPVVPHGYIVEFHLIYAAMFATIATLPAAQTFGLSRLARNTFFSSIPVLWRFI